MAKIVRIRIAEVAFVGITFVLVLAAAKVHYSLLSILSRNPFEKPRFDVVRSPTLDLRGYPPKFITSAPSPKSASYADKFNRQTSEDVHESSHLQAVRMPAGSTSLRGRMKRHEPQDLNERNRIVHHVASSGARAEYLHRRLFNLTAAAVNHDREAWLSSITSIPGGYSMSLSLGSPPQTFFVMVDTGSDLTWVQSRGCTQCFDQPSDGYEPDKSSTYEPLQCSNSICHLLGQQSTCATSSNLEACNYSYEYGDQSTTNGRFSTESMTIATMNGSTMQVPNFAFGVATDNSVNFGGVDGLLGLGQGPISFPSQLGTIYGSKFSYCLQGYNNKGGTSPIIFGDEAVPRAAVAPYSTTSWPDADEFLQYTPLKVSDNTMASSSTFWIVNLQGFSITIDDIDGPELLAVPQGTQTIVDSGTTISMLEPGFYMALRSILLETVEYTQVPARDSGLDLCFNTNSGGHFGEPHFPKVTFNFELANWGLSRDNTFIPVDNEGTWCLAMIASAWSGLQIFGNVQQANFQIIYDQPNARLGFVPIQCDYV